MKKIRIKIALSFKKIDQTQKIPTNRDFIFMQQTVISVSFSLLLRGSIRSNRIL